MRVHAFVFHRPSAPTLRVELLGRCFVSIQLTGASDQDYPTSHNLIRWDGRNAFDWQAAIWGVSSPLVSAAKVTCTH